MRLGLMLVLWVAGASFFGFLVSCNESVFAPVQPNASQYSELSTSDLVALAEGYYFGAHDDDGEKELRLNAARSICIYLLGERRSDLLKSVPQLRKTVHAFVESTMEILLGKKNVVLLFFGVLEGLELSQILFDDSAVNQDFLSTFSGLRDVLEEEVLEGALYLIPKGQRAESDFIYITLYNMILLVMDYMVEMELRSDVVNEVVDLAADLIPFGEAIGAYNDAGGSARYGELVDRIAVLNALVGPGDVLLQQSIVSFRAGSPSPTAEQEEELMRIENFIDPTDAATLAGSLPTAFAEAEERLSNLQPEFDALVVLSNNVTNLTNTLDMSITNLQNDARELVAFLDTLDERIGKMEAETDGARNAFSRHMNMLFGRFLSAKDRLKNGAKGILNYQDVLNTF